MTTTTKTKTTASTNKEVQAKETVTSTATKSEKAFDNEKRLVIFQNNQRKTLNHPIMRGSFVLNGKSYNVSIWTKSFVKDGKKEYYWQGQITEPEITEANETEDLSLFMDKNQADA